MNELRAPLRGSVRVPLKCSTKGSFKGLHRACERQFGVQGFLGLVDFWYRVFGLSREMSILWS